MRLVTPLERVPPNNTDPTVYLGGPIVGSWHDEAARILSEIAAEITVASPRCVPFHGNPEAQLQWELHHMDLAAQHGAILFWFPANSVRRDHRALFELGEWAMRSRMGAARVVVGVEKGAPDAAYLRRRLTRYSTIPVCSTVRQTCWAAVEAMAATSPSSVFLDVLKGWEAAIRSRTHP